MSEKTRECPTCGRILILHNITHSYYEQRGDFEKPLEFEYRTYWCGTCRKVTWEERETREERNE